MAWSLDDIPSLAGRTAVVTGANGGLGYQTARVLARRGAHVVLVARSTERAAEARDRILRESPGASLEVAALDLASLDAARAAGDAIADAHPVVDILVNNAGVMALPYRTTADGHELQLGVNHLGHVALTARLLPSVLRAPAGRIVWLTSTGRFLGPSLDLADPTLERSYEPWAAYGRSKRAALQVALELDARLVAGRRACQVPGGGSGVRPHRPAGAQRARRAGDRPALLPLVRAADGLDPAPGRDAATARRDRSHHPRRHAGCAALDHARCAGPVRRARAGHGSGHAPARLRGKRAARRRAPRRGLTRHRPGMPRGPRAHGPERAAPTPRVVRSRCGPRPRAPRAG